MLPPGLTYVADFLTVEEERAMLEAVETLPFHEVVMRGQTARRTVIALTPNVATSSLNIRAPPLRA